MLREEGAEVKAFDPFVPSDPRYEFLTLDLSEAVQDAYGILLLVNHRQFEKLNPVNLGESLRNKFILDTRNSLDVSSWQEAGFRVKTLGNAQTKSEV